MDLRGGCRKGNSSHALRVSCRLALLATAVLISTGCAVATPDQDMAHDRQHVAWFDGMRSGGARINEGQRWSDWLATPWMTDAGDPLRFHVHVLDGSTLPRVVDKAVVGSCEQLFDADLRWLQPRTERERGPYSGLRRQCYAARVISQGIRAETSLVTNFDMHESTFSSLPAELVTIMSPGQQGERVDEILRDGGSLGEAIEYTLEGPTVDVSDVERLKQVAFIVHDGWRQDWTWLARGDFNHDGVEDLLVSSRLRAPSGELDDHRLFVLTRRAADSPIELLQEIPLYAGEEADACSRRPARCGREIIR